MQSMNGSRQPSTDKLEILYVSQTLRRPQLDEDHRPDSGARGLPAARLMSIAPLLLGLRLGDI
jgi:hypothetical protein